MFPAVLIALYLGSPMKECVFHTRKRDGGKGQKRLGGLRKENGHKMDSTMILRKPIYNSVQCSLKKLFKKISNFCFPVSVHAKALTNHNQIVQN